MEEKDIVNSKNGIWNVNNGDYHLFDNKLAESLATIFKGNTVTDLGCGMGDYVKYLIKSGICAVGYDGNPNTKQLTDELCGVLDLSKFIGIEKSDWVLSLEVGEHIPSEYEDIFMCNLHNSNIKGIVLSWAIEGQYGIGHVNCRNNDYVINKLSKFGYKYNKEASQYLRENSEFPYFKNTLMVFKW